jgi:hypothetical protein
MTPHSCYSCKTDFAHRYSGRVLKVREVLPDDVDPRAKGFSNVMNPQQIAEIREAR